MLIGNIELLLIILICMMALKELSGPIYTGYRRLKAWNHNRKLLVDQAQVRVELVQADKLYKGFGLIKDRKIVTKDRNPLIFSTKDKAEAFAKEHNLANSKVVYQVWNPISKEVNIGEVVVAEELQKS